MTRPRRQLAKSHRAQLPAQRLFGDAHLELRPQPLAEINDAPSHHTVDRRNRPALKHRRQRRAVRLLEPGPLTRSFAVDQPVRTVRVELQHPIPDDLQGHPADLGSLRPARPVIDRGQSQQTTRLTRMPRSAGRPPQLRGVKIGPERDRHGEPPSFAMLNQNRTASGNPRVMLSGTWYHTPSFGRKEKDRSDSGSWPPVRP